MNSVAIAGRLTHDPELTKLDRTEVCEMRIVENGSEANPTSVDVSVFGAKAAVCARRLAEGRLVAVAGRLRHHEWRAPDGSRRSRHSIVAHRIDFLPPEPEESDSLAPRLEDLGLDEGELEQEGSEPVGAES
jgi:single-strand DNA-binding protein